jgi:hypothetical protein
MCVCVCSHIETYAEHSIIVNGSGTVAHVSQVAL